VQPESSAPSDRRAGLLEAFDIEVYSAGTNNDADNPLTAELVEWADFIFVMERRHRAKLQTRHCAQLKNKRVISRHTG
jgi:predicted protein tyrosine phosphatase